MHSHSTCRTWGDLSKLLETIVSDIKFEIGQIDQLFTAYADLFEQLENEAPSMVELAAIATILHSFYNGIENIFRRIAKGIDEKIPEGVAWHRLLLAQMTKPNSSRQAVLTAKSENQLKQYLNFRHFFRHSYSFVLDWDEMKDLALSVEAVWEETKSELLAFLNQMSA